MRRCPDAAPCDVVIAEFAFGVERCREPATIEVQDTGEWFRCCDQHIRELGQEKR